MKNKIEILSIGKTCWKTNKIIRQMKNLTDIKNIEVEYLIISTLDDFLRYKTWIFPTVIINGKIITKGYKPTNDEILNNLNN